jgi:hypothetical protein
MVDFLKYAYLGLSVFIGQFGARTLLGFPEVPFDIAKQFRSAVTGLDFGAAMHSGWQVVSWIGNYAVLASPVRIMFESGIRSDFTGVFGGSALTAGGIAFFEWGRGIWLGSFGVDNEAAHRHKWTAGLAAIVSLAIFMLTLPFSNRERAGNENGAANPDSTAVADTVSVPLKKQYADSLQMQKPDTASIGDAKFLFRTSRDANVDLAMARMQRRKLDAQISVRNSRPLRVS